MMRLPGDGVARRRSRPISSRSSRASSARRTNAVRRAAIGERSKP